MYYSLIIFSTAIYFLSVSAGISLKGNESPDAKYVVGSNINAVYLISTILFVVVPVVVGTK